jgi:hypothetical protein
VKRVLSWLWDWRTVVGLVAGFLIGLAFFGKPWGLPPAWGDIPTWLLAVLAAVAAWVGLSQLRAIQQQIGEETKRNIKRDGLLDKQLDEADARAVTEQRRQAEDIEVHRPSATFGIIENNSRRPLGGITCKVVSRQDRRILAVPSKIGTAYPGFTAGTWTMGPDTKPGSWVDVLRPAVRCGFGFDGLTDDPDQVLVTWFTDDAGFRWQLDEYLHLVQAGDNDEYKP